ncbi:hypothetical protein AB0910_29085 [Streptomyces sp. NPDC047002]|uniref:hypothetical protein n=1 Tax=Streptomyces sp. NPDC047002 TaxID=3155475 RepID=UPI003454DA13
MTRSTQQDDRTAGAAGVRPRRLAGAVCAVLWRHRGALARAAVRTAGGCGAAGLLLTAAVFALSWPVFTHMRNQRDWYRHVEDPYVHDSSGLGLVAVCTLPLFLLLLGIGSALLQGACSRAASPGQGGADRPWPVVAVYALRGAAVWSLPVVVHAVSQRFAGYQLDSPQPLRPGTLPFTLVRDSPLAALLVSAVLRLAFALAPAAAAAGLGPVGALRRSWSLTWTRAGWPRVLALALPLAALTAGALRLVTQLALPLRPLVRSLVEGSTGNFFAGYYAGVLAPVAVGVLATAALALPLSCTAFAVLHARLRPVPRARPGQGGGGRLRRARRCAQLPTPRSRMKADG